MLVKHWDPAVEDLTDEAPGADTAETIKGSKLCSPST